MEIINPHGEYAIPKETQVGDRFIEIKHRFPFSKFPQRKEEKEELEEWKRILSRKRRVLTIEDINRTIFLKKVGDGIGNPYWLTRDRSTDLKGFYAYILREVIDILEQ